jgi:hypothetical protein
MTPLETSYPLAMIGERGRREDWRSRGGSSAALQTNFVSELWRAEPLNLSDLFIDRRSTVYRAGSGTTIFTATRRIVNGGLSGCSATLIRSQAILSKGAYSTFAAGGGMVSDEGTAEVASNEYVNLDCRQSSSAIGRGSMPTPAHHEASSP